MRKKKNIKEAVMITPASPAENFVKVLFGVFFIGFSVYSCYIIINGGLEGKVGIVGKNIHSILLKLIGGMEWTFPFLMLMYGVILLLNKKFKFNRIKFFAFIVFLLLADCFIMTYNMNMEKVTGDVVKEFLRIGLDDKSGGIIAALVSLGFFKLFGHEGSLIAFGTALTITLLIFGRNLIFAVIGAIFKKIGMFFKKRVIDKAKAEKEKNEEKVLNATGAENEKRENNDRPIDNLEVTKTNKNFKIEDKKEEKPELKKTPLIKNNVIDMKKPIENINLKKNDIIPKENKNEKREVINETFVKSEKKPINIGNVEPVHEKKQDGEELSTIFEKQEIRIESNAETERKINEKIEKLEAVLKEYNISGKVFHYQRGPVITRFELSVVAGTRVKSIVSLSDDIAMNLEAKSIRIEAPIPGKNAIGIEIPNDIAEPVHFANIIEGKKYKSSKSPVDIVLGRDIVGEDIVVDLRKMPHLLIAGRTGSGKSVCINTLITSIIYRSGAEDVRFIMIDPKMVELMPYNGIPHLLVPVIIEPKLAAIALKWAVNEMEDRYRLLAKAGVRNLEGYNKLHGVIKLPYIVVVIDELADLMMVAPASIEESIARIAQKARAIGIHLVVATQRPSIDVITGTIKANLPSRISFAVASQIDSRTILDTPGAEKLLGRGDMLLLESGSSHLVRIQGAFITDEEVIKFTEYLKRASVPQYNQNILVENTEADRDDLFEKVVAMIKEEGKASTSLIQRKFKIGYSRAARIMDQLEEGGIVSNNENGEREIMV